MASRPPHERQESAREYGGEGLDSTPRTPTRHCKAPSLKSVNPDESKKRGDKAAPGAVNGTAMGDSQSETLSYADAVREDPADVERRGREDGPPNGKAENGGPSQPLPYADAVKEDTAGQPSDADVSKTGLAGLKPLSNGDGVDGGLAGLLRTPASEGSAAASDASGAGHARDLRTACKPPPSDATYPPLAEIEQTAQKEALGRDHGRTAEAAGIRWAPLKVPGRRRLQTLAVLGHSICMGGTLTLFFFLCANPFLWPVVIIYLLYILQNTDATDGRLRGRREWFRNLRWWTYFGDYFPARLHKTHDLPATRKYIFGYHPHGIISHGAWVAFGSNALGFADKFPGITNSLLTLDSNFRLPLYREYVLSIGCCSVSKEAITNLLTRGGPDGEGTGRAVTIVVGGARESLEAQPGTLHLILNERKGFVKLAVRTGADLVPVLAFGENELYDQLRPAEYPRLHRFQMHVLKVWKFTLPFLHGRGIFNYDVGMMPYRRPLNIVVGRAIPVTRDPNPQNGEVDRLHALYVAELQKMWDTYKDEFAKGRKEELRFLD